MISTAHNTKPFKLDSFRSSLRPRRALNCVLATISLVCVCAIAVVSAIVVREYSLSQAYSAGLCRLLNLTYSDQDGQCLFCSGAVDKSRDRKMETCHAVALPCLRVAVAFDVRGGTPHRGLLYDATNQATGQNRECSLSVCHKTRAENARSVEEFAAKIAAHGNASFLCYYDTESLDNAILEKMYSKMDVFHYLFWPSLIIVICGLVFLHAECHRKGMVVSPCGGGKAASPPSPLASPSAAAAESSSLLDGNAVRETKEAKKGGKKTGKESRLTGV